jgi:hypothetical protein
MREEGLEKDPYTNFSRRTDTHFKGYYSVKESRFGSKVVRLAM